MAQLIDGKKIAQEIRREIAVEVEKMVAAGGKVPHLAAILVGNDGASETYVASKIRDCADVGFKSSLFRFDSDIPEQTLLDKIREVNANSDIDGLIVQLPLPRHISVQKVTEAIHPAKDVDGFHPINVGRMNKGLPAYISATPFGITLLLKRYGIRTEGMHCVVLGRSNIVGSPMSILMAQDTEYANCTVTLCHSRTRNLTEHLKRADIIIAAMGKPGFLKGDMVKEGAVVIDVGITRVPADTKSGYALSGDVSFSEVEPKAAYITPVPGGVGPMTRVALLQNTLRSARKEIYS
jgi:methylenetetrahydrofolate dehydrogenase (NADP+) / methenyltetrahydrofolate cyclohydrolase